MDESELFCLRTISEFSKFVSDVAKEAKQDETLLKKAKLRNGSYNKYFKEYIPLYHYLLLKYGVGSRIKACLVNGNQPYDGVIFDDKSEIEKIEFSYPFDGEYQHKTATDLLQQESSCLVYWGNEKQEEIYKLIIKKAQDKANKDYTNVNLVFVIQMYPWFNKNNREEMLIFSNMLVALRQIEFKAKGVYFLILPFDNRNEEQKCELHCIVG